MMKDLGLLALRATVGGYVAAHGAQKLFGSFDGPGPEGMAGWLEKMGISPSREMAMVAGGAEFGGGLLTAAGLGGPIAPVTVASVMSVASLTAHRGQGPFAAGGGPELAVTNMAAALALAATGPGRLSLDRLFRVRVPKTVTALTVAGAGALAAYIVSLNRAHAEQQASDDDREISLDPAAMTP